MGSARLTLMLFKSQLYRYLPKAAILGDQTVFWLLGPWLRLTEIFSDNSTAMHYEIWIIKCILELCL